METNGVMVKSYLSDGVNNQEIETPNNITIKGILGLLMANTETTSDDEDEEKGCNNLKKNMKRKKKVISLGMGDPTAYSCFHSPAVAQDAVLETLASQKFNGYSPTVGLPQARNLLAHRLMSRVHAQRYRITLSNMAWTDKKKSPNAFASVEF